MFNLLPQHHVKRILREYRMRLLSVFCILAGVWGVLSAVFLAPSYVAARAELAAVVDESKWYRERDAESRAGRGDTPLNAVRAANRDIAALKAHRESVPLSFLLNRILVARGSGISAASFFYEAGGSVAGGAARGRITVRGAADTREALIAFADALRRDGSFESVDLPISNLAKDRDIAFSLIITGAF